MVKMWDYDIEKLKKTESGRLKILERMINYGPDKGEKIPLAEVKKNWKNLRIYPSRRKLLALLIWGNYRKLNGKYPKVEDSPRRISFPQLYYSS